MQKDESPRSLRIGDYRFQANTFSIYKAHATRPIDQFERFGVITSLICCYVSKACFHLNLPTSTAGSSEFMMYLHWYCIPGRFRFVFFQNFCMAACLRWRIGSSETQGFVSFMPLKRSRWGVFVFVFALAAAAGALFLTYAVPFSEHAPVYRGIIPWVGLSLSLLSFFVGHFSYPRVHNLKVYLSGYLIGVICLSYFFFVAFPLKLSLPPAPYYAKSLLLLAFASVIATFLLPSYAKYRTTKRITFAIAGAEASWLILSRFVPQTIGWISAINTSGPFKPWYYLAVVWFAGVILLSLWRLRDEFHLGGILTGTSLFLALAWLLPPVHSYPFAARTTLMATAPLFLIIGTVFHWFSRMEHRISYDPLLHIYNRNFCSKIISEQSNINSIPPFAVAMVDIDHFKKVNDTYGHQAGDAVLVNTAQAICREVVPDGVVCRYGGEEMAVFFAGKTSKEIAPLMENVRVSIEKMKTVTRKKKIAVTISCGVSHRTDKAQSIIDVIHAADKALYRAKQGGRNQVRTGKTSMPRKKS